MQGLVFLGQHITCEHEEEKNYCFTQASWANTTANVNI